MSEYGGLAKALRVPNPLHCVCRAGVGAYFLIKFDDRVDSRARSDEAFGESLIAAHGSWVLQNGTVVDVSVFSVPAVGAFDETVFVTLEDLKGDEGERGFPGRTESTEHRGPPGHREQRVPPVRRVPADKMGQRTPPEPPGPPEALWTWSV